MLISGSRIILSPNFFLFRNFSFTSCSCLSGELMFFICTWTSESFPQPFQGRSAHVALYHHSPSYFYSFPPLRSEDFTISVSYCTSRTDLSIIHSHNKNRDWYKNDIHFHPPPSLFCSPVLEHCTPYPIAHQEIAFPWPVWCCNHILGRCLMQTDGNRSRACEICDLPSPEPLGNCWQYSFSS